MRQETLCRMKEINEALRSINSIGEFDEELFGMLVERIKVIEMLR